MTAVNGHPFRRQFFFVKVKFLFGKNHKIITKLSGKNGY